jgi:hypothetical protein
VVKFKQIPPCADAESMGPLEPLGGKRNDNLKTKQSSLDCVQIDILYFIASVGEDQHVLQ